MSRALTRHQHLDPHRKYLLRKRLLRWASAGPVYMPFCGDGDIAVGGSKDGALKHEMYEFPGVYADRFVFGADLDAERVAVCRKRIPNGDIRVANCDFWPFIDIDTGPIAVADFDAWAEPWPCFRSFWKSADKADRVVMFFTDAHRMGIMVDGTFVHPDGTKTEITNLTDRRAAFHFYLSKFVWPWFEEYIEPYRVVDKMRYLRGMLTYWGAAIQRG
jgi:hypothetical protein